MLKKIISRLKYNNDNFQTLNSKDFDNLIPYLVLGIILGGRLGYVFIYNLEYYLENLIKIFFYLGGGYVFSWRTAWSHIFYIYLF